MEWLALFKQINENLDLSLNSHYLYDIDFKTKRLCHYHSRVAKQINKREKTS